MFASSQPSSSDIKSKMSSPAVHPGSLVDPALHSPALLELIDLKLSRSVIEYVVDQVVETVDFAMGRPTPSPYARGRHLHRRPEHTKFVSFVTDVLTRAEVTMPVVLASLVYIDRAKPHLHIALEEWALERVFLGAVIVASKYLNDSTLKNVHWALCTGVFGKRDVGRIEREFLDVLDFELGMTEADLLSHHDGVSAAVLSLHRASHLPLSPSATPYRHHRRRREPVPELVTSPEDSGSDEDEGLRTPDSETVAEEPAPAKQHTSSFHDLLRSFPLPIPSRASQQHHPIPIQVDA